ncbi:hypothetical protein RvY_09263-2 [Ramazzottius varieornatus]|uniref:DENN domain-containing protein 5B n=1 Tax=Ramazzottius varieornatus TaxID=947166 RepID=A0A1D1V8S2_RAMVA|nr:hypothetical protein RvY_09263-2 [Ramazzottius varieornatus]
MAAPAIRPPENARLADYFVICGLDASADLEPEAQAENDSGDSVAPLERSYQCRVLAHYPEFVPWNPFDEKAVRMLCMPGCLTFRTEKRIASPKYHTFLVTREDGTRYYGYALTFFEEVTDENICRAIATLQEMHLTEVASKRRQYVRGASHTNSLPRSMKIGSHRLTTPSEDISSSSAMLFDPTRDRLFVNKCICYVSQHQFVVAFRLLLQSLYDRHRGQPPHLLPLESYVFSVLYEICVPGPGESSRFYFYPDSFFVLQVPAKHELPLFEYPMRSLFALFGVDTVVDLVSCALLEYQILLCSKDDFLLMLVAECLATLLFPFAWQHVYVPILPESMVSFLDAPVPFIMGLHRRDRVLDVPRTEGNVCFVDIDFQKVRLPEESLPLFPNRQYLIKELTNVVRCYGATINTEFVRQRIQQKGKGLPRKFSLTDMTLRNSNNPGQNIPNLPKSSVAQPVLSSQENMQNENMSPKRGSRGNAVDGSAEMIISYVDDMRFNIAIREIFLNRFVQMFHSYEHFVLHADAAESQRESVHTFDKVVFLSDQPDTHLAWLSPFLETQMFATFIDGRIQNKTGIAENVETSTAFQSRVEKVRQQMGESLVRADKYQPCTSIEKSEFSFVHRLKTLHSASPKPRQMLNMKRSLSIAEKGRKSFPLLDKPVLNPVSQPIVDIALNTKRKGSAILPNGQKKESNQIPMSTQQSGGDMTPSSMVTENWDFVDKLLKECKSRTKRMLVEKLSKEAVELGNNHEGLVTGIEENTQIASLCDLLERVWNHGLHTKQGKSSLWSHLLYYQQRHDKIEEKQSAVPQDQPAEPRNRSSSRVRIIEAARLGNLTLAKLQHLVGSPKSSTDLASVSMDLGGSALGYPSRGTTGQTETDSLDSSPSSLLFDMKNVLAMPEVRTALGYARAWVRLSLEKKLLAKHLRALLADSVLLDSLYKRYAFLRNEDEREQFVFHLLSLNAVDFYCFTNTFVNTLIPYRVIFFPSRKITSSMPSNFWFSLSGALGDSGNIFLTKSSLQMVFQRKNLGLLTTIRIGLGKDYPNSKCLIDQILVRNEVTGHLARFPCGRWLGRNVDDGSVERLLVADFASSAPEYCASTGSDLRSSTLPRTPSRTRSPSASRRSTDSRFTAAEIQQILGDAANSIVKYYFKPEKERGSITGLLCGEMGLVFCLEQALLYGTAQMRLLRQIFVWNIFEKSDNFFRAELLGEKRMPLQRREDIRTFCRLVRQINSSPSLGKDGKFQVFAALSLRDRCLDKWLDLVRSCPIVDSIYDRNSFIRDPAMFEFLMDILESLKEFQIVLEPSITKGFDHHS